MSGGRAEEGKSPMLKPDKNAGLAGIWGGNKSNGMPLRGRNNESQKTPRGHEGGQMVSSGNDITYTGSQNDQSRERGTVGSGDSMADEKTDDKKGKYKKKKKLKRVSSDVLIAQLEDMKGENDMVDVLVENLL